MSDHSYDGPRDERGNPTRFLRANESPITSRFGERPKSAALAAQWDEAVARDREQRADEEDIRAEAAIRIAEQRQAEFEARRIRRVEAEVERQLSVPERVPGVRVEVYHPGPSG